MKFKKRKKVLAGAAIVLGGAGVFGGVASAVCKPDLPPPPPYTPHPNPVTATCNIPRPGGTTMLVIGCLPL